MWTYSCKKEFLRVHSMRCGDISSIALRAFFDGNLAFS